jgi:hypothetical protein
MLNSTRIGLLVAVIATSALGMHLLTTSSSAEQPKTALKLDPAIERARREVRMLDDIYKSGIVAITTHYVNEKDAIPAGTAFKMVFVAAEKKGWHKTRLVDATGEPINEENSPEDDFEKMAMKKLVKGETWVEKVEIRKGTKHLRVATPIPVVFDKCVMCHDHYADVPKGQAIGALTYVLPIDGKLVSELPVRKK